MTQERAHGDVCLLPMNSKRCQQGRKGRSRGSVWWIAAALIVMFALFAPVPANADIGASLVTSIADGTDTSSYDFPSATYSNNVLYIAFTSTACASGQDCGLGIDQVAPVESVSGAGLTFTEIGTPGGVVFSTNGRRIQAWQALAPSGAGTGAVTVTMQTGTISASMGAAMIEVTGTKTSGTNGADAVANYKTNTDSGTSLQVTMDAFADSNNRPVAFFSHRAASDTEVTRYLRWGPHQTPRETEKYLNDVLVEYRQGLDGPWLIEYKENQTVIGQIHLMEINPQHRKAQVGFVLSKSCWNQGMMTEALREVLAYAFDQLGLNRLEGLCVRDNRAAARVMEKAGMRKEGELREYLFQKGAFRDFSIYAMLRRDSQT